jgi:hypothetical protein
VNKIIAFLAAALVSLAAGAQTPSLTGNTTTLFTVSWVLPTVDSNGNPIPTTIAGQTNAITGVLVFEGTSPTTLKQVASLPGNANSWTTPAALAPGIYYFGVEGVNAYGTAPMSNTPEVQVIALGAPATITIQLTVAP